MNFSKKLSVFLFSFGAFIPSAFSADIIQQLQHQCRILDNTCFELMGLKCKESSPIILQQTDQLIKSLQTTNASLENAISQLEQYNREYNVSNNSAGDLLAEYAKILNRNFRLDDSDFATAVATAPNAIGQADLDRLGQLQTRLEKLDQEGQPDYRLAWVSAVNKFRSHVKEFEDAVRYYRQRGTQVDRPMPSGLSQITQHTLESLILRGPDLATTVEGITRRRYAGYLQQYLDQIAPVRGSKAVIDYSHSVRGQSDKHIIVAFDESDKIIVATVGWNDYRIGELLQVKLNAQASDLRFNNIDGFVFKAVHTAERTLSMNLTQLNTDNTQVTYYLPK